MYMYRKDFMPMDEGHARWSIHVDIINRQK